MLKTYFTCEKCNQTWEFQTKGCPQQVNVAARLNYGNNYHDFDNKFSSSDLLSMNWCRPCVDALHLHKPAEKQTTEEKAADPHPTTEEMLVSLLETLGFTREH